MHKQLFSILMLVLLGSLEVWSQQYPILYNVSNKAKVLRNTTPNYFLYSYELINDLENWGDIWIFQVDISRTQHSVEYDTTGLIFASQYLDDHFRRRYSFLVEKVVPVSFPQIEQYWDGGFPNNLTASFSKDTLLPVPGDTTPALVLMSQGLPSIRKYVVIPDFNEDILFPNIEDTTSTLSIAQMDSIRSAVNFHGITIGPSAPPADFDPVVWSDTLFSYTTQSRSLGWIADQATADKYTGYFTSAKSSLQTNNINAARSTLQQVLNDVDVDSSNTLTSEAYALLRYNTEYLLNQLPLPTLASYSLFATHSMHLEQNSEVLSGDVGVNEAGQPPFLDSQVELSIGIGTSTPAGYSVKANRIKVKSGSIVNSDIYFNNLDNNGTITGTQNTPLQLPLAVALPEFKSASPGTEDIQVPQNGSLTLQSGSYNTFDVNKNGVVTFTGGAYHFNSWNSGDNVQIIFQAPSEVRIADKFDSGQGSYIGPQDTTTVTADQIIFYVSGINGSNGNLGATPKAAKIGIGNTVWASFYAPNGTLWIRQNSQAKGQFIGKDVDVGIGVKVRR